MTVHSALELQGLSTAQGLTQALFLQAILNGHSSSEEQPTSIGAAMNLKNNLVNFKLNLTFKMYLTYFVTADDTIARVSFKTNTTHGSGRSC